MFRNWYSVSFAYDLAWKWPIYVEWHEGNGSEHREQAFRNFRELFFNDPNNGRHCLDVSEIRQCFHHRRRRRCERATKPPRGKSVSSIARLLFIRNLLGIAHPLFFLAVFVASLSICVMRNRAGAPREKWAKYCLAIVFKYEQYIANIKVAFSNHTMRSAEMEKNESNKIYCKW